MRKRNEVTGHFSCYSAALGVWAGAKVVILFAQKYNFSMWEFVESKGIVVLRTI